MRMLSLLLLTACCGAASAKHTYDVKMTLWLTNGEQKAFGDFGTFVWNSPMNYYFKTKQHKLYRDWADEVEGIPPWEAGGWADTHMKETPFHSYFVAVDQEETYDGAYLLGGDGRTETVAGNATVVKYFQNEALHPFLLTFDAIQRAFTPENMLGKVLSYSLDPFYKKWTKQDDGMTTFVFNIPNDTPDTYTEERLSKTFTRWQRVHNAPPSGMALQMDKTKTPVKSVVVKVKTTDEGEQQTRHIDSVEFFAVPIDAANGAELPPATDRILRMRFYVL